MSETKEKLVYVVTHGRENLERATIPFALANAALAMDVEAVICVQAEAVWLVKKGYVEGLQAPGWPPLKELIDNFFAQGGKCLVCTPCMKARNISPEELVEGAVPGAGAEVTQEVLESKAVFCY